MVFGKKEPVKKSLDVDAVHRVFISADIPRPLRKKIPQILEINTLHKSFRLGEFCRISKPDEKFMAAMEEFDNHARSGYLKGMVFENLKDRDFRLLKKYMVLIGYAAEEITLDDKSKAVGFFLKPATNLTEIKPSEKYKKHDDVYNLTR